jgi:hypothetical protein
MILFQCNKWRTGLNTDENAIGFTHQAFFCCAIVMTNGKMGKVGEKGRFCKNNRLRADGLLISYQNRKESIVHTAMKKAMNITSLLISAPLFLRMSNWYKTHATNAIATNNAITNRAAI